MTDKPKVRIKLVGEDTKFWLESTVNGQEIFCRINVPSIEFGEKISDDLDFIISEAFRIGHRRGIADCQTVIKKALGLGIDL